MPNLPQGPMRDGAIWTGVAVGSGRRRQKRQATLEVERSHPTRKLYVAP